MNRDPTAAERLVPARRGVSVIPENHTRNPYHRQHIAHLTGTRKQAGFTARPAASQ